MQSLFTMTHGVTAKPTIQNSMKMNGLKQHTQTVAQP